MSVQEKIGRFLESPAFGVVGASADRSKYGNKVLRAYLQNGRRPIPVNPTQKEVEGIPCVASVGELPGEVESISIITPPQVTEMVIDDAIAKGIRNVWMQPGAESPKAIEKGRKAGLNLIADGSCVLVVLGFRDH